MKIKILLILTGLLSVFFLSTGLTAQEGDIKDYLEQILPSQEGRKIVLSEATGMLTITDTPSNHRIIKKILEAIDIGPRQVMIEAKIVEVRIGFLEEKGIDWYWYRANLQGPETQGEPKQAWSPYDAQGPQQYIQRPTDWRQVPYFTAGDTLAPLLKDNDKSNLSNVRIPPGGINMSLPFASKYGLDLLISHTTFNGSYLRAYIHLLEEDGKANLLSAPRITTLSGEPANIQLTKIIPYVKEVNAENVGSADWPRLKYNFTLDEKVIGIKLEVTPFVSGASDIIRLEIEPDIVDLLYRAPVSALNESGTTSSKGISGHVIVAGGAMAVTAAVKPGDKLVGEEMGWPAVSVRNANATVYVKSGETIILGGLIRDEERKIVKKVPVLGHIPLLGSLFTYKYSKKDKRNLIIFITSTIITPEGEKIR